MSDLFLTAAEPFAWTTEDGVTAVSTDAEALNARRVTQCALARICGVCADPLGRPIVFVGTAAEVLSGSFHAPPLHEGCAQALVAQLGPDGGWRTVSVSAFEFVRPQRDDLDRRARFAPTGTL